MKQYVKMLDKMNTVSEVYVAHFLVLVRRNRKQESLMVQKFER